MDATTRWETEAIRSSSRRRSVPPQPTAKRAGAKRPTGTWLTLKEAEAATGIPTNTLRKWVRKDTVDSYLESDGELAIRMVRLESVAERAADLGRVLEPIPEVEPVEAERPQVPAPQTQEITTVSDPETPAASPASPPEPPEGTMLVPIDAWNKMLNQLGNLHEAGQMLADARERAAKAETEALFLRERLAELRSDGQIRSIPPEPEPSPVPDEPAKEQPSEPSDPATTTYWRYLTSGWRDRKKRNR